MAKVEISRPHAVAAPHGQRAAIVVVVALSAIVVAYGTYLVVLTLSYAWAMGFAATLASSPSHPGSSILFALVYVSSAMCLVRPRRAAALLRLTALWALGTLCVELPSVVQLFAWWCLPLSDSYAVEGGRRTLILLTVVYGALLLGQVLAAHRLVAGASGRDAQESTGLARRRLTLTVVLMSAALGAAVVGVALGAVRMDDEKAWLFALAAVTMMIVHARLQRHFAVGSALALCMILLNFDPTGATVLGTAAMWLPPSVLALVAFRDINCPMPLRVAAVATAISLLTVSCWMPRWIMTFHRLQPIHTWPSGMG